MKKYGSMTLIVFINIDKSENLMTNTIMIRKNKKSS
jgi:hypothetical protein